MASGSSPIIKNYMYLLKCFYIHAILLFFVTLSHAQNLVPNASFENLKTAPNCDVSVSKIVFENTIYDWFMPTIGTPDIYSTLLPSSCPASQPNSTATFDLFPAGHQIPRTGNNMAGFAPYISQWYREYIAVKLTTPLVVGKGYCCKIYVSLAENCMYDQNNLAMYFSDEYNFQNQGTVLNFKPQVIEYETISDSVNWVEIKGGFIATNAAQYLIIGNFDQGAAAGQNYLGPSKAAFSYYYIDDVSVEAITPPPLLVTGNHKVCPGDPLQLTASGWNNVRWYDSADRLVSTNETLLIEHAQETTYKAKASICNVLMTHEEVIKVYAIPTINLGEDKYICRNGSLLLDAGSSYSTYEWDDGSINQTYLAHTDGNYNVTVSNTEGCFNSDAVKLTYYPNPTVYLGKDIETCTATGLLIAENLLPFQHYVWQDGSTNHTFTYTQEGTYWVTVSNPCSVSVSDTVLISKIELFIPNLITPNEDGLNDELIIKGPVNAHGNLDIYNRFGAKVFSNEAYLNDWSGEHLSEGIYYYLFKYPTCKDVNGWIQVIR